MYIQRYNENPIITTAQVVPSAEGLKVVAVFNCGAIKREKEYILLLRVAEAAVSGKDEITVPYYDVGSHALCFKTFDKNDPSCDFSDERMIRCNSRLYLSSISHLRLAHSWDGIHFTVEEKPFLSGDNVYEIYGVEDPRITFLEGRYYITYSAVSDFGVCTSLAVTDDFQTVKKLGVIFCPDNKDVVLFPRKINGRYAALHRPVSDYFGCPEMWLAYSEDLIHWGEHQRILTLREGQFDSQRLGAGLVPILTEDGWLEIYHGADWNNRYCMGALLLDKQDPSKVLARCSGPIMQPEEDYEKNGFFPDVLFATGGVVEGDILRMYYGASDSCVCLATLSVSELLSELQGKNQKTIVA